MKVLVTSSRMPFAVDMIRKLVEQGVETYTADTFKSAPGSHVKGIAGHFVTASPAHATPQFVDDVVKIVTDHGIDMVLPGFEDTFYLATAHDRLDPITQLFTGTFEQLAHLHDKLTFQELCTEIGLSTPNTKVATTEDEFKAEIATRDQWFARACFSRGGVSLATNAGPLAGRRSPDDVHPTVDNPWIVQNFVEGPMVCSYTVFHGGKVTAHSQYQAPRQWKDSTGIEFEAVDANESLPIVTKLGEHLDYTGQLSFDYVRGPDGLTMIECNPRPTDGILLLPADVVAGALTNPDFPQTLAVTGQKIELRWAVAAQIFTESPKKLPKSIHDLVHVPDAAFSVHDWMPTLYSMLSLGHFERDALKLHGHLFDVMTEDIDWNGTPIDGMSDADRAVLANLASAATSGA